MRVGSDTPVNPTGFAATNVNLGTNDNPESLKKTLQDPNASMPDTMAALAKLYQMDGMKVANGTASDEEKDRHKLNDALRSGRLSDSERDQFASQLGMSADRMVEVQKQFGYKMGENGSGI
ncbi:hypothetical protein RY831_10400 [Noviherbaspirillum sp. CPCC 100848]|uniref:Uncharacterized protein n=1 Tax=Noviherbaspirillum album TaxID=3080276 RepID=A0ABU6J8E7_9BURK|nr:hypothetical protein [Noviherbaspirillum sp. CPCC 100848]MEC4719562.1 hypothetical protein [Noviherbaspirillum sp. CPCC 100848]